MVQWATYLSDDNFFFLVPAITTTTGLRLVQSKGWFIQHKSFLLNYLPKKIIPNPPVMFKNSAKICGGFLKYSVG